MFYITNVRIMSFTIHVVRAKQGLSFEDTCKKENTEYRYIKYKKVLFIIGIIKI